jgi:2-polyprenyl-3-methyl-5-hydroxy-6-metoxy-1,4-benzoquinol methylase
MNKDQIKCILCGNKKLELVTTKLRDGKPGSIYHCQTCDLGILIDHSNPDQLRNWYDGDYRKEHGPKLSQKNEYKAIFEFAVKHQEHRVRFLKPYLNDNTRLLDVGCSTGQFIHVVRDYIKEAVGTDLDVAAAKFAHDMTGCKTFGGELKESPFPHESFDVVTATHVLEHAFDPLIFLNTLNDYLKPGATIYLEVPNMDDALLKVYNSKTFRTVFYHTAHRWYFTKKSLIKIMEKLGFEGEIFFPQMYNVLNHMQWALVDKPMNAYLSQGTPNLPMADFAPQDVKNDLQKWIQDTDLAYSSILAKYGMTDQIAFIGKKK